MMNNLNAKQTNKFLGKTLATVFLFLMGVSAAYAQSGRLYETRSNYLLGTITAYQQTWRIDMGNRQEIKIYSCRQISATGLACVFTQFKDGRTSYSGEAQIYQSGAVNLRWVYEFTGNQQRQINGGWNYYQVR